MIRSKLLLAATFGLACALPLSVGTASAQSMGMAGHPGMAAMHEGGSPFLMLLRSANLTPAQQSQIHLILNSDRAKMQNLHQQLFAIHEQLAGKLLGTAPVTAADLKPLVQQASRLEQDLNQNMADTALAIRNVLTPDQVAKLAQVHQKLHNLHMQIQGLMGPDAPGMPGPDN